MRSHVLFIGSIILLIISNPVFSSNRFEKLLQLTQLFRLSDDDAKTIFTMIKEVPDELFEKFERTCHDLARKKVAPSNPSPYDAMAA